MNFITWSFVLLFLPVFAGRLLFGQQKTERSFVWLTLVASTIFVMWHVPVYILIMLTSIGVDFLAAQYIDSAAPGSLRRRWLLFLSMTTNLLLLGFFKYADFALKTSEGVLNVAGFHTHLPRLGLILPMGISFYTFGSMSYTVDVYRGRMKPVRRFQDFYYFVTFFPHLVAGPIVRAEQFFYQFARTRRLRLQVFNHGVFLIIRGAFLKMVCADNIAVQVNAHWPSITSPENSSTLVVLTLLFAAQIFCDFEGYSSIARGLAYLMGYRFPLNFDNPYIATSFSNFWERWHITLSRWLRDYLYVPLGGNRISPSRTYINLLIVMVLGGLWHGAALTFIAWGAIHGLALAAERKLGFNRLTNSSTAVRVAWYLCVQSGVMLAWIFFRSSSVRVALHMIHGIAVLHFGQVNPELLKASIFILPVVIMHLYAFLVETHKVRAFGRQATAALAGAMLAAVIVLYGASTDFIYFQF